MSHSVVRAYPIPGGTLRVRTAAERLPLDDLLGFAARANPRRPFLFVSKVLGRHVPCRPSRMRETYRLLTAASAGIPGPVWVIGMAETATGLAAGVADTLARVHARADVSFHHTTRLPLGREPLAAFRETHSHAPSHLLHAPQMSLATRFSGTRSLVLVDDEISTGKTLSELAAAALPYMPCIERVTIATLVNWLDGFGRLRVEECLRRGDGTRIAVSWASLLDGSFAFEPDPGFVPANLPLDVEPSRQARHARADLGRRGISVPEGGFPCPAITLAGLGQYRRIAVIGTGECAFEPFLVAEALEAGGYDTTVQCTSRSPIRIGGAVAATLPCPDPYGQGVGYYLHNPPGDGILGVTVCERDPGYPPVVADGAWLHRQVPESRSGFVA